MTRSYRLAPEFAYLAAVLALLAGAIGIAPSVDRGTDTSGPVIAALGE